MSKLKKIVITGGIACGKSTVTETLKNRGWTIIDTDLITHDLQREGTETYKKIVDAFGKCIINTDKSINRRLLGQLVFSDLDQRQLLNSILHPVIRELWRTELNHQLEVLKNPKVVVVIPLLFEVEQEGNFDTVVCVACNEKLQKQRLKQRGLSDDDIDMRLKSQLDISTKASKSSIVIWNNGSIEHLQQQINQTEQRLLN